MVTLDCMCWFLRLKSENGWKSYGSSGDFNQEVKEKYVTERVEGENPVVFCLWHSTCLLEVKVTMISGEWGWREEACLLLNTLNTLALLECFTMYADHRSKKSAETMNNEDTYTCGVGVGHTDKLHSPRASETCWAPYLCVTRPVLCTEGRLAASPAFTY